MKKLICILAALSMILSLASCKKEQSKVITFETQTIPDTVDPLIASNDTELTVLYNIFEPLLLLEEDGSLGCGAAESYQLFPDKKTITFTLRKNAKWSDGNEVTGEHFAFNLKRAVTPSTRFAGSSSLVSIKNAEKILSSEMSADSLGISYDDRSLTVYLDREDGEILYAFAGPAGMPCRQDFFESSGGKYCMTKQTTISNGPFAVSRWIKSQGEEALKFIKNERYTGPRLTELSGVYIPIRKSEGRLDRLKNGNIECGVISPTEISQVQQKDQLLSAYSSSVVMAFSSAEGSAFADAELRKALYLSVDREKIETALPEYYEKAGDIVAPGAVCFGEKWRDKSSLSLPGATGQELSDIVSGAKDTLSKQKVTSLTIGYETDDQKSVINYTAQSWQKNFGIRVETVKASRSEIIDGINGGSFAAGIFSMDTDQNLALPVLLKLCRANGGTVTDEDFVNALSSADKSCSSLEAAEQILVEKCLVMPMYYGKKYYVFSSDVTGQKIFNYSETIDFTNAFSA